MRKAFLTLQICFCALVSFFAVAQTVSAAPLEVRSAIPSFNVQYLPAMIAEEKGFFKQENLDSKLILMRGGNEAVLALNGGYILAARLRA